MRLPARGTKAREHSPTFLHHPPRDPSIIAPAKVPFWLPVVIPPRDSTRFSSLARARTISRRCSNDAATLPLSRIPISSNAMASSSSSPKLFHVTFLRASAISACSEDGRARTCYKSLEFAPLLLFHSLSDMFEITSQSSLIFFGVYRVGGISSIVIFLSLSFSFWNMYISSLKYANNAFLRGLSIV